MIRLQSAQKALKQLALPRGSTQSCCTGRELNRLPLPPLDLLTLIKN